MQVLADMDLADRDYKGRVTAPSCGHSLLGFQ
jgi:hypothetical protein